MLFEDGFLVGLMESATYSAAIAVITSFITVIVRNTIRLSGNVAEALRVTLSDLYRRNLGAAFDEGSLFDKGFKLLVYVTLISPIAILFSAFSFVLIDVFTTSLKDDASLGRSSVIQSIDPESSAYLALISISAVVTGYSLAAVLERTLDWVVNLLNILFFIAIMGVGGSVGFYLSDLFGWPASPGWALPTASVALVLISAFLLTYYAYGFVPDRWKSVVSFEVGGDFNPFKAAWWAVRTLLGLGILTATVLFIIAPALG